MKYTKKQIYKRVTKIPAIKFEDQNLTSFAGLVIYQPLFRILNFKEKLRSCFTHLKDKPMFNYHTITLLLIVHLILGYRRLRDIEHYKDDPMVKRILGLNLLPDVSTVSRILSKLDGKCILKNRQLNCDFVIARFKKLNLKRITLDFDGSVCFTKGKYAEGTAVGFNKKKKGSRSYYPLFCTVAQTSQVLDVLHRPGNVHDSRGAKEFMEQCIAVIRRSFPSIIIEIRMDSAFFSEEIVFMLDDMSIEFTASVPFERFDELKTMIEERKRWNRLNDIGSYFESRWKPKKWPGKFRFVFIRQKVKKIRKKPIQLDLFTPYEYKYEFKVIVTNKKINSKKTLQFHHGRGSQEKLLAELKSQCQLDYIPVRRLTGNQLFLMAAIMCNNITRELQLMVNPTQDRGTTEKRSALWQFREMATMRHHIVQRAGRITYPKDQLTLTMSSNKVVKEDINHILQSLKREVRKHPPVA